ncbi:MAG: hypothetical protein KDA30_14865, partial [Phycisphaerales bacterium]|nr:hypothetical protein [Phycisphaerales bacterium]
LLIWALAVFLFDVGTRRVAWDRLITREVAEEIRAKALHAVRARSDRAATTASTLRRVSEDRAAPRAGGPPPPPAPIVDRRPGSRPVEDDADAARAAARAKQEEERKRAARRRMLGQLSGKDTSERRPPAPKPDEPKTDEDTTSGLLRAKKRARERMDQDENPPPAT